MNLNWGVEGEIEGEIEAKIEANIEALIEGGDKRDEQTGGVKRNRGEEEEGGGVAVKKLLGFSKALVAVHKLVDVLRTQSAGNRANSMLMVRLGRASHAHSRRGDPFWILRRLRAFARSPTLRKETWPGR